MAWGRENLSSTATEKHRLQATVNVIFMDHVQRIVRGHFTLRRLERGYAAAFVRRRHAKLATVTPRAVR
jgi:hypothetical protein